METMRKNEVDRSESCGDEVEIREGEREREGGGERENVRTGAFFGLGVYLHGVAPLFGLRPFPRPSFP